MPIKNIVVGAGFAGSIIARRIAEEKNEEVLILEQRNHIGGNAYDFEYEVCKSSPITVHKYGPHIFHTNNEKVFKYLTRFTEFNDYQHRVEAYVDGNLIPLPISAETVNKLFNLNLSTFEVATWFSLHKCSLNEIKNSEDAIISQVGEEIFEKIFKNYTKKQWDRYPNELSPEVTKRIPIRTNRDTRYFSDKFQGLPKNGYSHMFLKILDHPLIKVELNTKFNKKDYDDTQNIYYSGPVDEFYEYEFGKIEYRSLNFVTEILDKEFYQKTGTVNYPNDHLYTRISEFKHMTQETSDKTIIMKEYSTSEGDPYYIVPTPENQEVIKKYQSLETKNVTFIGRLGECKYYNMDQIVEKCLSIDLR